MKNRIVAPSRLVSALDACRSRLKAFIRGRTPLRDEADDILQEVTYRYRELAEESGVSEQALLSRKHKAVLYLRTRLRALYDELLAS